jgi:hypothetical protein
MNDTQAPVALVPVGEPDAVEYVHCTLPLAAVGMSQPPANEA